MFAQTKHRFSVKEYYRMAESGVLPPDARVELLKGEIIDLSPIGPVHSGIVNYLNQFFSAAPNGRWVVSVQNPLRLDDFPDPQPDLMLLKPAPDFYRQQHPRRADVFLLVEISDTTLEADLAEKLPAYGRAGILEVWIVNLNELTVEMYREPHFTGYSSKTLLRVGSRSARASRRCRGRVGITETVSTGGDCRDHLES